MCSGRNEATRTEEETVIQGPPVEKSTHEMKGETAATWPWAAGLFVRGPRQLRVEKWWWQEAQEMEIGGAGISGRPSRPACTVVRSGAQRCTAGSATGDRCNSTQN